MAHHRYHFPQHGHFHNEELWNWHDIYFHSVSTSRIVTRSQTAFNRIEINDEEMKLFGNKERHQPPDIQHLMFTMKDGLYGAIPRTIVTRSTSDILKINPVLSKTIEVYKSFYPMIEGGHVRHETSEKESARKVVSPPQEWREKPKDFHSDDDKKNVQPKRLENSNEPSTSYKDLPNEEPVFQGNTEDLLVLIKRPPSPDVKKEPQSDEEQPMDQDDPNVPRGQVPSPSNTESEGENFAEFVDEFLQSMSQPPQE